jgi:hypothetical protein
MRSFTLFIFFFQFNVLANDKLEYDWLTLEEVTGSQVVHYKKNSMIIDFEFTDRGMGPKLHDEIQFSEKGLILNERISGHSYMGATVNEKFNIVENKMYWRNSLENEERNVDELDAFFVAANGTPQSLELLVRAINNTPSHSLKLLPSGEATVELLKTIKIKNQVETKKISLFAISGLGYTPEYVWLDSNERLFALGYGSMGMILKGWKEHLSELQNIQDSINNSFLSNKSQKLTYDLGTTTVINNVNVFNSIDSNLLKNKQVIISDGKISEINSIAKKVTDAHVIDGRSKTLMAGLWDMHTHISLEDGMLNVASGITNVRDVGNVHKNLMDIKERFFKNEVIGPNIYAVGLIDKKLDSSAPSGRHAESIEQALSHVDWYYDNGYSQVKMYSSIPPEWIEPIASYAHKKGMKVSGHIPALTNATYAVKHGFDEIHHMNMVFRNFVVEENEDYRNSKFTLVGERGGKLNLDSEEVANFISLLKDKNAVVDPTLAIFHSLYLNKAGEVDPNYIEIADNVPATIRRDYFLASMLDINSDNEVDYSNTASAFLTMTKMFYDAGVPIVAGSDSMAGFTLHRELELLSEAGIPNDKVLKIATVEAAKLNNQDTLGTIQIGNEADLILINGNPLNDMSDIRKVSLVIKNGKMFKPSELFKAVGVKPLIDD